MHNSLDNYWRLVRHVLVIIQDVVHMLHRWLCTKLTILRSGANCAEAAVAWKLGGLSKFTWHEADVDADAAIVSVGGGRLKDVPRDEAGALAMLEGPGHELKSLKC